MGRNGGFNPYRDTNGEFATPVTSGKPGRSRAGSLGQNWQGGKTRARAAGVPTSGRPRTAYGATLTGTRRILQAPSQAVYKQASAALKTFRAVDSIAKPKAADFDKAYASRIAAGRVLKRTSGETAQQLGQRLSGGRTAASRVAASGAAKIVASQARRKSPKA